MGHVSLDDQIKTLVSKYKHLQVFPGKAGTELKGTIGFRTNLNNDAVKDKFEVSIRIPSEYPRIIPTATSIDGRIPEDFHTNHDGTLCLDTPIRLKMRFSKDPTLIGFVEQLLIPYLAAFSVYEREGRLPFGAWQHGGAGILQCYKQMLSLKNDIVVLRFLYMLSEGIRLRREKCPCGMDRRYNGCHRKRISKLRRFQTTNEFYVEYKQVLIHLIDQGQDIDTSVISSRCEQRW